jgi:hypothetical protein
LRGKVDDTRWAGKNILSAADLGERLVNVAAFESDPGDAGEDIEEAFTLCCGALVVGAAR